MTVRVHARTVEVHENGSVDNFVRNIIHVVAPLSLDATRAGSVAPTPDYPVDYKLFDATSMTGSYSWVFDGEETKGAQYGNCYLGTRPDVCTINFYETGPEEGISLIVAKNASFFFESWFYVASLSAFQPAHIEDETDYYHNMHNTFIMQHDTNDAVVTAQR